ncbi:hypothetical protein CSC12_1674 [Klebsiella michiganensis]|nr:hypothetical protein CSC12_1674 [Klebsiella michiganensis]
MPPLFCKDKAKGEQANMIFEAGKVGVNMVSEIQLYSLICII